MGQPQSIHSPSMNSNTQESTNLQDIVYYGILLYPWMRILYDHIHHVYFRKIRLDQYLLDDSTFTLQQNPSQELIQTIELKRQGLQSELVKPLHPSLLEIHVRRDYLMEDSFQQIMPWFGLSKLNHAKIKIHFIKEEAIDAGGVTREWLNQLAEAMINPSFGLFQRIIDDPSGSIEFTPLSTNSSVTSNWYSGMLPFTFSSNQKKLQYYEFFGMILGKVVYESQHINISFHKWFYKQLLDIPCDFEDLQDSDPEFFKHLMGMLDYNIDDAGLDLTFSVNEPKIKSNTDSSSVTGLPSLFLHILGSKEKSVSTTSQDAIIDLKPNGRNLSVTNSNKFEYISLITEYKLMKRHKVAIDAFKKGFYDIIPKFLLQKYFNADELELLICGLPSISLLDWFHNTEYQRGITSNHFLIQWFWIAMKTFTYNQRIQVLQFVTGSTKVPLKGFAFLPSSAMSNAIEGMPTFRRFNLYIDVTKDDRYLPTSRTCFNQLIIPRYSSYEILREKLLLATSEGNFGFGTI